MSVLWQLWGMRLSAHHIQASAGTQATPGERTPEASRTPFGRFGLTGFFAKNSRNVVDVKRCAIAVPEVNEKLKQLRKEGLRDGSHRTLRGEGVPLIFTQTNSFVAYELLAYVSARLEGKALLDA